MTAVRQPDGSAGGAFGADVVARHRAALMERLGAGEDGLALGRANARFLDTCLRAGFNQAAQAAGLRPRAIALAAVGSLGRGAVALRSDADVVVVFPET